MITLITDERERKRKRLGWATTFLNRNHLNLSYVMFCRFFLLSVEVAALSDFILTLNALTPNLRLQVYMIPMSKNTAPTAEYKTKCKESFFNLFWATFDSWWAAQISQIWVSVKWAAAIGQICWLSFRKENTSGRIFILITDKNT